ncbi:MAG TPA: iron ABC transporter permease [Polyangiaceae bacterium]|nr:iron ABC transporter permease [Polyangiaceae bacterium]
MRLRSAFPWLVTAVVAALFACFLFWPLWETLRAAFFEISGRPTLAYVALLFRSPVYVEGFVNALGVATMTTVLALSFGFAIAFLLDRYDFVGKRAVLLLVPMPLIVPPFVGAIGFKQILGRTGSLNALLIDIGVLDAAHAIDWLRHGRFWAVVVLTAMHLYPILYFNISAALSNVNPEMEEAAESLGCTGVRKLAKITLPLILPSVFAATTLTFIWALTELGVPLMCDYTRITSVQIFAGLKDIGRVPLVHALVTVVLLATVALYLAARLSFGRVTHALATKGDRRRTPTKLASWRGALVALVTGTIVAAAALPNVGVVLAALSSHWYGTVLPSELTLSHFEGALGHAIVLPSIGNSLRYVALSTALDAGVGLAIAYVVVRTRFKGAALLDAAAMIPLAVPGLVMAFGYLAISRDGRPFAFLDPVRDPTALLVMAYAIRRLPFVVRSTSAGLQQVSVTLEEASQNLGASSLRTFRRVTLPLLAPHLLAGGVFAFALSMLEVSDSLILAQRQSTFPITKAIFELFQLLGEGRFIAAALGVWAMAFLGVAIAFARSLLGRRFGGIFRF